jgi:hypothetical protein
MLEPERGITMRRRRAPAVLVLAGSLCWAGSAHADAVADWNLIAVQTVSAAVPPRPGPSAFLDMAMVQAAVYDAVVAITGGFRPYHIEIPGATGSPVAATAKAAHDVLAHNFPAQAATLDMLYDDYLADAGLDPGDPGVAVGEQAAAGIIALRADDGSFPSGQPPFTGGTDPGVWRPTPSYLGSPPLPPPFAPAAIPWMAKVTPYFLTSPSQFRAAPPPSLLSGRYTRDYNEVKALGELSSTARTPEQTDLAYFWAANFLAMFNQLVRDLAAAHVTDISQSARLFALVDMSMVDAGITAWDSKFHYVFWRPITAIQEGDNDGNPRTDGDPSWQPLINTPNYPEYTSGANNVTRAATRMLALFFGKDKMTFSITTTNPLAQQKTRTYHRLSDVSAEVVDVRILQGIHFRSGDVRARQQGFHVANWAFHHFLRPIHGHQDDDED